MIFTPGIKHVTCLINSRTMVKVHKHENRHTQWWTHDVAHVQYRPIDDHSRAVCVDDQWHSHMQTLTHWHVREAKAQSTCRLCSLASILQSTSLKAPSSSCRDWLSSSPLCSWRQWETRSSASLLLACSRLRCCYKSHRQENVSDDVIVL